MQIQEIVKRVKILAAGRTYDLTHSYNSGFTDNWNLYIATSRGIFTYGKTPTEVYNKMVKTLIEA